MAITTVAVTGKVVDPSGAVATGGSIKVALSAPAHADDGGTEQVVGGKFTTTISASGVVSFNIAPNDGLTPSDTYYYVELTTTGASRASWAERWTVASTPDPVDIGDIERVLVTSGQEPYVMTLTAQPVTATSIPAAAASQLGNQIFLNTGSGETASYQCHRTAAGAYEWIYAGAALTPQEHYTAEPVASSANLGASIFIDTGSGETYSATCHRTAASTYDFVMTANGGT